MPLGGVVGRVDGPLEIGVAFPNHVQHRLPSTRDTEHDKMSSRGPPMVVFGQLVLTAQDRLSAKTRREAIVPHQRRYHFSHLVGEKLGVFPPVVVERHPLDETNVKLLVPGEF